jgi:2-haloacid dehalogenase
MLPIKPAETSHGAMSRRPAIVCDVNETLLDLETLRPTLERVFEDSAALRLWFAALVTYSEALTLADVYVPFTDIGASVLRMLAATRGVPVSDDDVSELSERFASMPPHPDVAPALRRLRDRGFALFTLTDNTLEISERQLESAGLLSLFNRRFSVDKSVRRHKPAVEAYESVASALQAEPGDICMVANHVWDTIGATAAGWQAGLVLRTGNAPLDIGPQPTYIGEDLHSLADQLIDRYPAGASSKAA